MGYDAQQRFFAVYAIQSARQRSFTVQTTFVVRLRQRLCRAFLNLCRAPETHDKGQVSLVIVAGLLEIKYMQTHIRKQDASIHVNICMKVTYLCRRRRSMDPSSTTPSMS